MYNRLDMSGHSHFATIRRQKEANDATKGKVFSKMAKIIAVAVKEGGGADPDSNYKLRVAIETARSANVPKDNIKRAIEAAASAGNLEELTYEGFGPGGIQVMVEVMTDNRNRTAQEIKNVFERSGGTLGGPNSVAFNFEKKGFILLNKRSLAGSTGKSDNADEQMLKLIDLGVEDVAEGEDGIAVYVAPVKLIEAKKAIEEAGFAVSRAELIEKPKQTVELADPPMVDKVSNFLDAIEEHEDVHKVYTNVA